VITGLPLGFLRRLFVVATLCVAVSGQIARAEGQTAPQQIPGFPEVQEQLARLVEQKEIAGAVATVVTPSQVLHLSAVGQANIEKQIPMQTNSICFIASMTKPITGLAVCKLEEEGKLKLDDPVSKYIPEFKELKNKEGEPVEVTILQLLTHTSGLQEIDRSKTHHLLTLKELIPYYVEKPIQFQPGTQWKYCQSSINTAGHIVEIVSGVPFDEYLAREFFEPLKMVDTTFYLTEAQLPRLVETYRRNDNGELEREKNHLLLMFGKEPAKRDRTPFPNMGLYSTAPDYARLAQMLLNQGELDGKRILKPETVKRFRTMHTPAELSTAFTPGNSWGVATCVVRNPQGITAQLSPGTFGHGGAYGTQVWIDPERNIAWVLMVQRSNFKNGDASVAREVFQEGFLPKLTAPSPR